MKRTIKRTIKRTTDNKIMCPITRNKSFIKRNSIKFDSKNNLGGYLPGPPQSCPKKNKWIKYKNKIWIDLSLCHSCSKIKECGTRELYLAFLKTRTALLLDK